MLNMPTPLLLDPRHNAVHAVLHEVYKVVLSSLKRLFSSPDQNYEHVCVNGSSAEILSVCLLKGDLSHTI